MSFLKNTILKIIYPEKMKCLNCGSELFLPEIEGLCFECLQKLSYIHNCCHLCGRELEIDNKNSAIYNDTEDIRCEYCGSSKGTYNFAKARSIFVYEDLGRELIFHLKYFNKKELAIPLGELLYIYYKEYFHSNNIDFIIPVPLYPNRKKERGYNQAALLAKNLKKRTGIPIEYKLLIRAKKTPPLYDLNRSKRETLIKGVFSLNKKKNKSQLLKGKNILLVDDIFTTGTTVNEIANLLKNEANVKEVYVLTLATARVKAYNYSSFVDSSFSSAVLR